MFRLRQIEIVCKFIDIYFTSYRTHIGCQMHQHSHLTISAYALCCVSCSYRHVQGPTIHSRLNNFRRNKRQPKMKCISSFGRLKYTRYALSSQFHYIENETNDTIQFTRCARTHRFVCVCVPLRCWAIPTIAS